MREIKNYRFSKIQQASNVWNLISMSSCVTSRQEILHNSKFNFWYGFVRDTWLFPVSLPDPAKRLTILSTNLASVMWHCCLHIFYCWFLISQETWKFEESNSKRNYFSSSVTCNSQTNMVKVARNGNGDFSAGNLPKCFFPLSR